MTGLKMMQFPFLVDESRNFFGVKMLDGREVRLAILTADGLSLADGDGNPFTPVIAANVQKVTPNEGNVVQMVDNRLDGTLYLAGNSMLQILTVRLPSNEKSRIGQTRTIFTKTAIANFNLIGADSIMGNVGSLAAEDTIAFRKVDDNTWVRI